MDDSEYLDFCAAMALSGLIARTQDDEEDIRHKFYILCREAYRAADEMVELRKLRQSGAPH
jgi:hypothetical protein